jgi:hypothetical protein
MTTKRGQRLLNKTRDLVQLQRKIKNYKKSLNREVLEELRLLRDNLESNLSLEGYINGIPIEIRKSFIKYNRQLIYDYELFDHVKADELIKFLESELNNSTQDYVKQLEKLEIQSETPRGKS